MLLSDFIPEIVGLCIDGAICGVLYTFYSFSARSAKAVEEAPSLSVAGDANVRDAIRSHASAVTNEAGETILPYASVSGTVAAISRVLKSQSQQRSEDGEISSGSERQGVVQRYSLVEHKNVLSRAGFWYESRRTLQEFVNHVPFCLVAGDGDREHSSPGNTVHVRDCTEAARLDLDVVNSRFDPAPNHVTDYVLGWISGDRKKGLLSTEEMLLTGTTLTAIGELSVSKDGNVLKIQPPSGNLAYFLIQDSKRNLLRELEADRKVMKYLLSAFAAVGLALLGCVLVKLFRRWKLLRENRRIRRRLEEMMKAGASPSEEQEGRPAADSTVCIICLSERRQVAFQDCGHVIMCLSCAMDFRQTSSNCPICRGDILNITPVFLS